MTESKELKTSDKWLEHPDFEGIKILDPDGWDRKNYQYSFFEELITKEEFNRRFMLSTVISNRQRTW